MQNKYPLWKNIALICIMLVGFIYALPNFYSEQPVVQISSDHQEDLPSLLAKVNKTLIDASIQYTSSELTKDGVQVRFSTTDLQLLAQDKLKQSLGSGYTVALNLMSSTPSWLLGIGAEPMKQGLDLRGGVHFLLEVDVQSVIERRYEGFMKSIGKDLREANIRYSGLHYSHQRGIIVNFRSPEDLNRASQTLSENYPSLSFKAQQSVLKATLAPQELHTIRQNTIEQTMSILRNRVNELGVGEAIVQQQGSSRVAVDLPGIQDAARAKQILGGTATLEFHMVDDTHDPVVAERTGMIPVGTKLMVMDKTPVLLMRQVILSGDSITSAVSGFDQQTSTPSVQIQLGGGGEALFTKTTRDSIGKRMAILYVETKTTYDKENGVPKRVTKREEKLISVAVIQSALGTNFQITGLKDSKEATNLALLLRAGALPTAIIPIEERTVGPSLGKENIHRGILSLEVGMGLILITMVLYYRLFGLVANFALLLNIILLCAFLSIIGATLTLPGIAGIVLTVGMAVDANVLINERIREELRRGLSPQAAIYAGYERAFTTIVDANLTTLIVALVLFSIGTGSVRGFAVTLSIGLLTSMLTGVTYTRAIINWIYGRRNIKKLSIGI